MPTWIEVNITPADQKNRENLLLKVVDPLVHRRLSGHVSTWFYFWECDVERDPVPDHVRLRILWRGTPAHGELASFLDAAKDAGDVAGWYEGSHGLRGETYQGEAGGYGEKAWEAVCRDWMAASEFALTLIRLEAAGDLEKTRSFHWMRRTHLFTNMLLLDDVTTALRTVHRYLERRGAGNKRDVALLHAIDRYLFAEEPGDG